MTRALKDLVGIFVVLTLLHDFADLTPAGLLMFVELCVAMGVLTNSLVLSLKHQSIWLSQTLGKLNKQAVRLLLPLLIAAHLALLIWCVFRGAPEEGLACIKYLRCNFFVVVLLFCHLQEHSFYSRSVRLVLLWACALTYTLNYCNTTAEQTTMARLMRADSAKMLLILSTLAALVVRSLRTVLYLYNGHFKRRRCRAGTPP